MIVAATWTGSIPSWLLLFLGFAAMYRLSRGGGGSAVSELSKANEVLEHALEKERVAGVDRQQRISALEAKTDIVLAVSPLIAEHERLAAERHGATIQVLGAMRDELHVLSGKEPTT